MSDRYFTFPLAVLRAGDSPYTSILRAFQCGIISAGKGFKHRHGNEAFEEKLEEKWDQLELPTSACPDPSTDAAIIVVGAAICNVSLAGGYSQANFDRIAELTALVITGGPLVKMKRDFLWAALMRARAEENPDEKWPTKGISWREFRILCAILSAKINRSGFSFIGWETIQARACGFTTKEQLRSAETIPCHLAPPLTRKQIRSTCDALEDLGFYARFRLSCGKTGGLMAYSFRHDRNELAKAVCDSVNFHDRSQIRKNRETDASKCLESLERAKRGQAWPSVAKRGQAWPSEGQVGTNRRANIMKNPRVRNPTSEKSNEVRTPLPPMGAPSEIEETQTYEEGTPWF